MPRAPEHVVTTRLILRRPTLADADEIFRTYAADPEPTRFVGFPRHRQLEDTLAFIGFSDAQWAEWPAGPYLLLRRDTGAIVGSAGLRFQTPQCASAGYVLAERVWGQGYATEALAALVETARTTGVVRLFAICHHTHQASARVLEKGGFALEGTLRRFADFPNLTPAGLHDVLCFSRVLENVSGTEGEMRS